MQLLQAYAARGLARLAGVALTTLAAYGARTRTEADAPTDGLAGPLAPPPGGGAGQRAGGEVDALA
eukprot:379983-Prymnesium_polylepis.1